MKRTFRRHTVVVLMSMASLEEHALGASAADAQTDTAATAPKCMPAVDSANGGSEVRLAAAAANSMGGPIKDPAALANLTRCSFAIPAMPLPQALKLFSKQAEVQGVPVGHLLKQNERSGAIITPPIRGVYGVAEAVQLMVAGSGFDAQFTLPYRVIVVPRPEHVPSENSTAPSRLIATQKPIDEISVEAMRPKHEKLRPSAEMQPYAVIERDEIERLGVADLDSVINRLITANISHANGTQGATVDVAQNQINFRGLGVRETLVLIDDRYAGTLLVGGTRGQADFLGAIPAAAVERIELLPASAAGRYGGGATAGIVNVVRRRDCPDGRVAASYGNSFQSDTLNHNVFVSQCIDAFNGHTQLSFSANEADYSSLQAQDRDFAMRGRNSILNNNPSFFMGGVIPPVGKQTNVHSVDGSGLGGQGTSPFLTVPEGYTRSQGLGPLLANLGHYNLDLANSSQLDAGGGSVIRSGPRRQYLDGNVQHKFTDKLTGHVDFTFSRLEVQNAASIAPYAGLIGLLIPKGAPGNVFDQAVYVSVPAVGGDGMLESRVDLKRTIAGMKYQLPGSWSIDLEFAHALSKQEWNLSVGRSAADAVIAGQLDVFRDLGTERLELSPFASTLSSSDLVSRTSTFSLRTQGVLASFRDYEVIFTGLLERRKERFDGGFEYMDSGPGTAPTPMSLLTPQTRSINTAYAEIRVPMGSRAVTRLVPDSKDAPSSLSPQTRSVNVPLVELQLAGRIDQYVTDTTSLRVDARSMAPLEWQTSRFETVNPTLGMLFRPFSQVTFRASFGTGFVPPSGDQLAPPARTFLRSGFRDPKRGNEPTPGRIDFQAGGNPTLRPERSRSWSAGIALEPEALRGLQASLDFVEIRKTDDIVSPADLARMNVSVFEQRHPERVTRSSVGQDDRYGIGMITAIDASDINVAQAKIRAWDLNVRYRFEPDWTAFQRVDLFSKVTYQPEFSTRATPDSVAENDVAVTADAPLRLAAMGGMTLTRGPAKFSWTTRYFGQYQVSRNAITLLNQGGRKVGHQTYHDVALSYELPLHSYQLDGLDLQASVQNVFDREPPFDAGSYNYFSPFGDARGAVYTIGFVAKF